MRLQIWPVVRYGVDGKDYRPPCGETKSSDPFWRTIEKKLLGTSQNK